jgi:hypothetical protein
LKTVHCVAVDSKIGRTQAKDQSLRLALRRLLLDGESLSSVAEIPKANLSIGMRQPNGMYLQTLTAGTIGSAIFFRLASKRSRSKSSHLLELCR